MRALRAERHVDDRQRAHVRVRLDNGHEARAAVHQPVLVLVSAEHEVDAESFAASGLLGLRVGQRVRFELESDASNHERVTNLDIVSL